MTLKIAFLRYLDFNVDTVKIVKRDKISGQRGYPGAVGGFGLMGSPGEDAGYCACPQRRTSGTSSKAKQSKS